MKLLDFAFTPQVFDPHEASSVDAWKDAIIELTSMLFRGRDVAPLVVCNFQSLSGGHDWRQVVVDTIERIADQSLRRRAQDLLSKLQGALVQRPPTFGVDAMRDEQDWAESIHESHRSTAFDGIVVQSSSHQFGSVSVSTFVGASDVLHASLLPVANPLLTKEAVADDLRVLFRYSDRVIMSMPYGPCQGFAVECLRRNLERSGHRSIRAIDVHIKGNKSVKSYAADWRKRLAKVRSTAEITCHFWPDEACPRERVILGCSMVDIGEEELRPKVRWGISMTHVPGEGDDDRKQPITRAMLNLREASEHLKFLTANLLSRGVISERL